MSPSADERREVAARLRVIGADEHAVLIDCIEAAGYRWSAGVPSFARRLADLIEPTCEMVDVEKEPGGYQGTGFCSKCGELLLPDFAFCPQCGSRVTNGGERP